MVLQRDAFPELVQEQVTPKSLAEALERVLEDQAAHDACREVATTMRASIAPEPSTWGARAAAVVRELAPAVSGD